MCVAYGGVSGGGRVLERVVRLEFCRLCARWGRHLGRQGDILGAASANQPAPLPRTETAFGGARDPPR